ncbi:SIMPL domain-containing protein [Streptomyces sp. NPDC004393]|uniref:SIMPL domain-containing protein n=1 Tax=Streptomyces sp. NPDC004533 TaxID=3154278 RepID=UPI0033B3918B
MTSTPVEPRPAPVPYGTPDAPRLAVRGEAHLEVAPDVARLGITVGARGTDRHATLDDLTRRNTTVLDLVRTCADAVRRLETGHFTLSPELTEGGHGERVHAYHGRVHITAELTDFTALGELTTRLAALELTQVDGPSWDLDPDSPAHGEARRQAVHDAMRRAREYADALGTTLTALVELADIGADNAERPAFAARSARRTALDGTDLADGTAALVLEPRRQHVHARIDARFTMAPPRL